MTAAFYLFFGFVDSAAEAVVYLFVDAGFVFIPYKVWNMIDGGIKLMAGLPKVLARFASLLPS